MNTETRKVSSIDSALILLVSAFFIIACILFNLPLYIGFLGGLVFSMLVLLRYGYSIKSMLLMCARGIRDCRIVFVVITLMGTAIAIWMASGIVPSLIYYGLEYIKHVNFLLACFLITCIVAAFMGTAVGTVSTIGIALLAIGRGLGIPVPLLLGTVVSGAFVADRLSPISSLVNLTIKTANVKYQDYFKTMLGSLIPSVLITSVIYFVLGQKYMAQIDETLIKGFQANLHSAYFLSPLLLLFPLVIIVMASLGVKVVPNISIGIAVGIVISVVLQKANILGLVNTILFGYKAETAMPELNQMLHGGGIIPMLEVMLIVAGAVAISSLFEGVNIIRPIIDSVIKRAKSKGALVAATAFLSSILTVITCDQTVGILFLGRFLQQDFEKFGMDRTKLARTISDTGTTIAPLIPWNVNSLIILVMTGVEAAKYAPFAFLCFVTPIVTVILGFIERKITSPEA